jgi:hypothetical protein
VNDKPGASAHLLPAGTDVPSAAGNPELVNQINLNDGVDDKTLAINAGVIPRGTGASKGTTVRYWSFGLTNRGPSPLYKFVTRNAAGDLTPLAHPPLVDALPGEAGYSAVHTINQVVVTADYAGQLITNTSALADAIDLGLVEQPIPTGKFVASPIVLPGTMLDVGGAVPVLPETVYGHGYAVGAFEFGGPLGVQPGDSLLPTNQVSFLRNAGGAAYDATRPIFQATIPTAPPTTKFNYTPLCVVLDVDLTGSQASSITGDDQLFTRSPTGAIMSTSSEVQLFQVTTTILMLPLQFTDGAL